MAEDETMAKAFAPPPKAPDEPVDIDTCDFKRLASDSGEQTVKYFSYTHLRPDLRTVSRQFALLAFIMLRDLPRSAERAAGLRKLLEAKDCAVRAVLP